MFNEHPQQESNPPCSSLAGSKWFTYVRSPDERGGRQDSRYLLTRVFGNRPVDTSRFSNHDQSSSLAQVFWVSLSRTYEDPRQYSDGNKMQVEDLSASVITHQRSPSALISVRILLGNLNTVELASKCESKAYVVSCSKHRLDNYPHSLCLRSLVHGARERADDQ